MKGGRSFLALESLAVLSSLSYTVLISYNSRWCWPFALLGAGLYLYLCLQKRLYAESLLQVFYLGTGLYGWLNWGEGLIEAPDLLPGSFHLIFILSGLLLALLGAHFLRRYSNAAVPGLDAFTTVFSVLATLLMINLYAENWWYWIVIDAVSVWLYLTRKMHLTAGLFLLYTFLAINGLIQWQILS